MGTFLEVEQFVVSASRCRYMAELDALLSDFAARLGFDYFALVHHVDLRQPKGAVVALWSYPEAWVEEYLAESMATNDPVHLASHRINIGFRWDQIGRLIPVTSAHHRIRERTRRAGIDDGFTVPANIPGEANGSCSFAVARGHSLPTPSLPAAQLLGAFAFHAARRLAVGRASACEPPPRLSPRQLDCVVLAGRGYTDGEAGSALGIAEDTVTEYLDEARHRYGVSRRATLILRAIFDGQIALSDVLIASPP
jgi:LuxR family quorum-sensing system transcriptional regulator CciR